jgi:hypothetical protein
MYLSTWQNSSLNTPYMFAFTSGAEECYNFTHAYYVQNCSYTDVRQQNQSATCSRIALERCTVDHFSVIPGIKDKFATLGLGSFYCLPINQTYEILGNYDISNNAKTLEFVFGCTSSCNVNDCGYIYFLELNAHINPDNN